MSVYITPEIKSEDEIYAMLRIANDSNTPIIVENILTSIEDDNFNNYLLNLVGLTIPPKSSYRFYATNLDCIKPPQEEFTVTLVYKELSRKMQDSFVATFPISFKFMNMCRTYSKTDKSVQNIRIDAEKQKWAYYSLRWDLERATAEKIEDIVKIIYNGYKKCKAEEKEYEPLSDEEIISAVEEMMVKLKEIRMKEDRGLEKHINK